MSLELNDLTSIGGHEDDIELDGGGQLDIAVKNAGGKLPEGYKDIPHPPPPPPPAVEDQDIMELSMELNAATIDDVSDLDESGMERIPTADPGLEVETRVPLDVLH